MTNLEIIRNNTLIAEFMGAVKGNGTDRFPVVFINIETPLCKSGSTLAVEMLKYNNSWDWLMMVVEKIESSDLVGNFEISHCLAYGHTCRISPALKNTFASITRIYRKKERPKIYGVYESIVEFIEWYNKSKYTKL